MDLRRATLLLILGSAYTVLQKAAYGLVPALSGSRAAGTVTSILWLVATFALMLFAYEFLREIRPRDKRLRYSLILVIAFTGCVSLSKLPVRSVLTTGVGHRLLLGGASTLNPLAMVVFVASLRRLVASGSPLRSPLRALTWGLGIEVALGLVSTGYLSTYLLTGREVGPLPFLQPLAMLSFLFTYGMTLWFLIRFWRIGSYADLLPR